MAYYEVAGTRAGVNTPGSTIFGIRSTVSTRRIKILEIGLEVSTAPTTGQDWRLVPTTTLGTSSTTVAPLSLDLSNTIASVGQLITGYSALPTLGTVDLRRLGLPNTQGSSLIWSWPEHRPLEVNNTATGQIAVANANATGTTLGAFAIYVVMSD